MALTSADLARLGPKAQKQVLDKLVGEQNPKKSKYGNRKVVRDVDVTVRAFLALEDLTGMTFRELFGECEGRK